MISLVGVLLAAVGGVGPLIVAFVPRLGVGLLAHLGKVNPLRRVLGIVGWLLIWQEWRRVPSLPRRLALLPGTIFAIQSQFLEPRRIFVDLVDPPHRWASQVRLPGSAVILGAIIDEQPHAWTYANLVPRHLINDVIGQIPVLAAY